MSVHITEYKCGKQIHNTAQNSSDNLPSYAQDNHHCSDVYWKESSKEKMLVILFSMLWLQVSRQLIENMWLYSEAKFSDIGK